MNSREFELVLLSSQNIVIVHAIAVGKTRRYLFIGMKLLAKNIKTGGLFIGEVGSLKDE